jgi:hypothetical protein
VGVLYKEENYMNKLRLWDECNKIMHYDVEYISSENEVNDWIIFKSDKQKLEDKKVLNNPYFKKQCKIMEHTGMDQDIYESDIVHITAFDHNDNIVGEETCVVY